MKALPRGAGIVGVLGAAVLSGCAPAGQDDPPAVVECTVLFRPQTGSDAAEQQETFEVERPDGVGEPVVVTFPTMSLGVQYAAEVPDGSSLTVTVQDDAGSTIVRDLYQPGVEAMRSEFAGGHGFTGLQYAYNGDAELQYSCAAREPD